MTFTPFFNIIHTGSDIYEKNSVICDDISLSIRTNRMSNKTMKKIQKILFDLHNYPEGKKVLAIAELTGIEPVSDDKYNPHRLIVKSVLGEDY